MGSMIIYDGENGTGDWEYVTYDDANLGDPDWWDDNDLDGWNDRISSIEVISGSVDVYEHADKGGIGWNLPTNTPGHVWNLAELGLDNAISSWYFSA